MKTTLVIMAAGMGSRFGGLKQIEPVGQFGEIIADYSIYDAKKAGFNKVVFIIKKEIEAVFRETIYNRISKVIESELVYQELNSLPHGLPLPSGRVKPWGTGHAVMCAANAVKEPFMVINADDFYGASAFVDIHDFLTKSTGDYDYCMAGYYLKNTVSAAGHVSRGICTVTDEGYLTSMEEMTHIEKHISGVITYTKDDKKYPLNPNSIVSMNSWGFKPSLLHEACQHFSAFYKENMAHISTAEYYLPSIVNALLLENKAKVKVIPSRDFWYGFTYKEDKQIVSEAIDSLIEEGKYPIRLW